MKMLLAGPGTGKTTRVKEIIAQNYQKAKNILVLSFTNATVNDLTKSFSNDSRINCCTLHSYALRINHLSDRYILDGKAEAPFLEKFAESIDVDFEHLCSVYKCITFDNMISECVRFLSSNPVYADENIGKLDLFIVDEFQDFNESERKLVYLIAGHANDTIILGDDDQSIYGFKDADPVGIIDLYRNDTIEKLEHEHKCYRCPGEIVDQGILLISKNKNRVYKPWNKINNNRGIVRKQFSTQAETNNFIVDEIEQIRKSKPNTTFLVLNPVRYYVDELIQLMDDKSLEYVNFWAEPMTDEQYRLIWWLKVIYSERKLLNLVFLSKYLTPHFKKKFKSKIKQALQKGIEQNSGLESISEMFNSDLVKYVLDPPQFENLIHDHPEFSKFSEFVDTDNLPASLNDLFKEIRPKQLFNPESINVMSIHKSKGLEADVVFINSLVDGVLPNNTRGIDTIEAQRRLFFVGITRAKRLVYLLASVKWDGRFVNKVDKSQFQYSYRDKKWNARFSKFVDEMKLN